MALLVTRPESPLHGIRVMSTPCAFAMFRRSGDDCVRRISLTGAGGLATLGVGGVLKLASSAEDAKESLKALGISAKTTKLAVAVIGGEIAVGTLALAAWASNQAAVPEMAVSLEKPARMKRADSSTRPTRMTAPALVDAPALPAAMELADSDILRGGG